MGVVGVPAGWGIFRLQNEIFSSQRDDSEQNLYRLDLPTLSLSRVISVTTLGIFFKFLATNCLTKVVQIFWWLFLIMPLLCKKCVATFWAILSEIRPLFISSSGHTFSCDHRPRIFSRFFDGTRIVPSRARNVVCKENWRHHFCSNGREPWSSGYERRLMFYRLWVRIPAPYTVFHKPICCKICIVCLKRRK